MLSTTTLKKPGPIINVRGLNVIYPLGHGQKVQALSNINLEIYQGEFIIFFGPSGCGKSTLLYSISGLESHAQGEISVNGHPVTKLAQAEAARFRQREIGMIFQAFYLIPTLSVFKNVMLPQMAISAENRIRQKLAHDLLEHFDVLSQAGKLPTDLSGGQQQRVAICRALINDPGILLADEPVGNLDSKSSVEVIRLIADLNVRQKKTVILVTHDPAHLHFADRVFHMLDGRIIDTTVNRAIKPINEPEKAPLPIGLELLIRSFSQLKSGQLGTLLIPFKAKEIVTEAVAGLPGSDIEKIEHEVQSLLIQSFRGDDALLQTLDLPRRFNGLGLDHRTAVKLSERIEKIIEAIKTLQLSEQKTNQMIPSEAVVIRNHLVEVFLKDKEINTNPHQLDLLIWQRLKNQVDQLTLVKKLHQPRPNGLGLNLSLSEKIAQRVELIILGKFESNI